MTRRNMSLCGNSHITIDGKKEFSVTLTVQDGELYHLVHRVDVNVMFFYLQDKRPPRKLFSYCSVETGGGEGIYLLFRCSLCISTP